MIFSVNEIRCRKESVTLNISCYQTKYTLDFKVEVLLTATQMKQDISCHDSTSEGTTIVFEGHFLEPSYSVSVQWISSESASYETVDVCLLSEAKCTPLCEGTFMHIH